MQERLFVGGLIWQLRSEMYFVLDLLFGQDGCEFFHLKDLADFDFGVAGVGVGATLGPLDGFFEGPRGRLPFLYLSSFETAKRTSIATRWWAHLV
jgi:hypothetical protein